MSTNKRTIDWYNKNAKKFADHVRDPDSSPYHSFYEKPVIYSLLPDIKGKNVLSLGSGTGEANQYFKERALLNLLA